MRLLFIDNYDSFTYNLVHYLGELGATPTVFRNDAITLDEVASMAPQAIVLSPGPCTPDQAGICMDLVNRFGASIPMLGVCLGHQSIGQALGAKVVRAPNLMHGKTSPIDHTGNGIFAGLAARFIATRYHSLILEEASLPPQFEITARADGLIMAMRHVTRPLHSVQFHPESIASEHGHALLKNFLELAREHNLGRAA
ncbi:MAG: aminodeoxychorismate/anthranilate synthase component II [Alphaproteobacteria bacterium]|nr:aminodeoxychorismate/anthranilate synthase component II [Alphaproteobacteria bacterium]